MSKRKPLLVSDELHEKMIQRADKIGMKLYKLTEKALLEYLETTTAENEF